MVSIGTPKGPEMPRHPADYTTAGRQRWESKDPSNWERTFGHARRNDRGRTIKRWRADGTSYTVRRDNEKAQ